jgi:putative salt-induced outer membrane protein
MLLAANVYAQDEEEIELGWTGNGEFGLVNTTGNTESFALNMRLEFIKTTETWRHRFAATSLVTTEDGDQDNERYTAEIQSDRKLGEKSYLFGVYRYDADRFGAYDPQQTATAGYGRELMKSEKHELKGEIGAGYRNLKETVSGDSSSEVIVRLLLDDTWQVFKSSVWTNRLLIETGADNTFTQFNTGLAVSMTDKFAVKLGFEIRNNSKVPPGDSENTDTITTMNLVYNF